MIDGMHEKRAPLPRQSTRLVRQRHVYRAAAPGAKAPKVSQESGVIVTSAAPLNYERAQHRRCGMDRGVAHPPISIMTSTDQDFGRERERLV